MYEAEYMSSSEKLCALLDGELSPAESETLFYELASNPALQDEMKEHLSIRKMFGNAQLHPPTHLKAGIEQTAGLTASSAGGALAGFFLNRGFIMAVTAMMSTLATVFIMSNYNTDHPGKDYFMASSDQIIDNEITQPVDLSSIIPAAEEEIPIVNSIANDMNENTSVSSTVENDDNNNSLNNDIAYEEIPENREIVTPNINLLRPVNFSDNGEYNVNLTQLNMPAPVYENTDRNFEFQIRGFTARSMPEVDIAPLVDPVLNNFSFSLLGNLTDNLAVGVELGQENLNQVFYNDDKTVEQNYMAFWWGVSGQYSFTDPEDNNRFYPLVRATLGGTRVGPIGRGLIGLKYDISSRFNLFAGIEGTVLVYNFDGRYFSTRKIGMSWGASVKF